MSRIWAMLIHASATGQAGLSFDVTRFVGKGCRYRQFRPGISAIGKAGGAARGMHGVSISALPERRRGPERRLHAPPVRSIPVVSTTALRPPDRVRGRLLKNPACLRGFHVWLSMTPAVGRDPPVHRHGDSSATACCRATGRNSLTVDRREVGNSGIPSRPYTAPRSQPRAGRSCVAAPACSINAHSRSVKSLA